MIRRAVLYCACAALMVAAGLLCRWSGAGLPPVFAKYAGSVLWGAMVYWVMALLLPRSGVVAVTLISAVLAIIVEVSQLVHGPWLDAFRRTTVGVLLIGRYFSEADIVAYLVGIAAAGLVDRRLLRSRHAGIPDSRPRSDVPSL